MYAGMGLKTHVVKMWSIVEGHRDNFMDIKQRDTGYNHTCIHESTNANNQPN